MNTRKKGPAGSPGPHGDPHGTWNDLARMCPVTGVAIAQPATNISAILTRKLTLRLSSSHARKIEDEAARHRVSVGWLLRHLVIRYLEGLTPIGMGDAKGGRPRRALPSSLNIPDQAEKMQREFSRLACSLYDGFRSDGCEIIESVKRTNFALKELSHPWATYDIVSQAIRSTGRFRKSKG